MIKKADLIACANCKHDDNCINDTPLIGFYQERCKDYSLWKFDNLTKINRWQEENRE